MIKHKSRYLIFLQLFVDAFVVIASWMLAYYIRFNLIPGAKEGAFPYFVYVTPLLVVVTCISYMVNDLYHPYRYMSWFKEAMQITSANMRAFAIGFVFLYFATKIHISRISFALYFILLCTFSILVRLVIRNTQLEIRRRGGNKRQVLLVGSGDQLVDFVETVNELPLSTYQVMGWVDSNGKAAEYGIPEIDEKVENLGPDIQADYALIAYPLKDYKKLNKNLNYLNQNLLPTLLIPNIKYEYLGYRMMSFYGIPLMEINPVKRNLIRSFVKRIMDILGALAGLILFSPAFLVIPLLVKLSSKGPVFYGQERMSVDGGTFKMWKFRSMPVSAEKGGAQWATKGDKRTTPIGGFLRKTSLDEIPQFWNVLKGEMSLVGPRPERPVFIDEFKKEIPAYMLRHKVKAGITGWAQINGWRGNTSLEKRIEFDIYYIKNWTILFDIKILLLTFVKGFINPNAY